MMRFAGFRRRRGERLVAVLTIGLLSMAAASSFPASAMAEDGTSSPGSTSDPAAVDFFEKSIRPLLATRCRGCHGSAKQKGGLRLDSRAAILAGGNSGPAIVPGDVKGSLLVDAINYGETVQMPPKSKLPDSEVAALKRWVEIGAPWGRDVPPASRLKASSPDFQAELHERARFWSFQALRDPGPPAAGEPPGWARNPIDRFILAGLESKGLKPSPEAPRRTLIRRLSYDLTGLPPPRHEIEAFLADRSPDAYERLVERLLASPHYGERWARHWLDLVRYAETAGHEFDYDIPNAYRYRDYVIRALNPDLPYDRFLVEHLAGDLLECPRRHPVEGYNESIIATGFFHLGEGVHSPVDVREEEVRRIDNQIDVMSKAFLGLTVACARCHDHKFDPIASRDYYALAGFLRSSRFQQAFIDPPDRIGEPVRRLIEARDAIRGMLDDDWKSTPVGGRSPPLQKDEVVFEDFNRDDYGDWHVTGNAFGDRPSADGDVRLKVSASSARLERVKGGLAHSGLVSNRLQGVLRSRTFAIESRYIHYLVSGRGGTLNVVVDGFEKIRDPIYGGLTTTVDVGDGFRWITQDVGMWIGHTAYLEIADGAVPDYHGSTTGMNDGHGYLAVDEIRMSSRLVVSGQRSVVSGPSPERLDLDGVLSAWQSAQPQRAVSLRDAIARYRAIEATIPSPRLALAVADGTGMDEHLHIRGNPKNLGEIVPRRFLEVLGGEPMSPATTGSGRLDLARRLVDPRSNPLTPRVLVNRLWKHHFGEGIVRSTDDFGAMGREPSHPELLDWLASRFVESGWSIKAMHRLIVTSSAYRMSSIPAGEAERLDPDNTLLHRRNVRRLEAEAVRDALLGLSGRRSSALYGPSVPVHLTAFMDGRGRPAHSGPLDGDGRRSLYLGVRRNFLNPMFLAFDSPAPFSCIGRRNTSNVPAQALILLNDPLVIEQARRWARQIEASPARSDRERLEQGFVSAFGRPPSEEEARDCLAFLGRSSWADLCHVLVNMKEFLFID
jgi:cytochrome c553